jgi:hypothetical protein
MPPFWMKAAPIWKNRYVHVQYAPKCFVFAARSRIEVDIYVFGTYIRQHAKRCVGHAKMRVVQSECSKFVCLMCMEDSDESFEVFTIVCCTCANM